MSRKHCCKNNDKRKCRLEWSYQVERSTYSLFWQSHFSSNYSEKFARCHRLMVSILQQLFSITNDILEIESIIHSLILKSFIKYFDEMKYKTIKVIYYDK